MAQNSLIQVRVEDELKQQADKLFTTIGMDTPTAIRLFLKQSIMRHGIPFPVTAPDEFYNDYNIKLLEDASKRINAGQGIVIKTMEELEAMENE